MQATHMLLLLLFAFIISPGIIAANEDQHGIIRHRLLKFPTTDGTSPQQGDNPTDTLPRVEIEERAFLSSAAARVKGLFKKNSGLSSQLASTRKNADIVAAVENMPIAMKLDTAMKKDPSFVKGLSKDPELIENLAKNPPIGRVSRMLEKKHLKVSKRKLKQLRAAADGDEYLRANLEAMDVMDDMILKPAAYVLLAVIALIALGFGISFLPQLLTETK
uniref:Avh177 n=1 Tax=Phytophthora sojae TaxID=67593 RepID=G1FRV1_PHYSO|nr:Avh177 [Phytophthora sojae]AEK80841.1 Avh177 [Phytophthora sojae]